ncbi:MAG: FHA domain-containing protein [Lysobacterales bacterium]
MAAVSESEIDRAPTKAVLEVHERSGALRQRLRLDPQQPLHIGRALDNELILDDPYVCPHHAVIRHDDERGWLLCDDNSINGLRLADGRRQGAALPLQGRMALRLGHTQLLFRSADEVLSPTAADPTDHRLSQALGSVSVSLLMLLLLGLWVGIDEFLDQSEHQRWLPPLAEALGGLAVVSVWALAWSIVNRLFAHRLNYPGHLSIAAGGLLLVLAGDTLAEYLLFAAAADGWAGAIEQLLVYGGLALVLWAHLGLIAGQPTRRQWMPAAWVSGMLFVLFSLPDLIDDEFRSEPAFHALLKPPAVQMVEGLSADAFYARARELGEAVDADLAESRSASRD